MSAKFSLQSFGPGELSYTFVIETDNGRTLVHPQLPEPAAIREEPVVIIISDLETSPGTIQRLLLRLLKGEGTFVIGRRLRKGGGSSVNVVQIVASEQAPGEHETAREPLPRAEFFVTFALIDSLCSSNFFLSSPGSRSQAIQIRITLFSAKEKVLHVPFVKSTLSFPNKHAKSL